MTNRILSHSLTLLYAALLIAAPLGAMAQDNLNAHDIYETRCSSCHAAHAGDFVADALEMTDRGLIGRKSGIPVGAFLETGHGRLDPAEIDALLELFGDVYAGGQVFRDKCLICHDRAVVLARLKLIDRDGVLMGRYTGREIASFLTEHGRLSDKEIPVVLNMLDRQLAP